MNHYKLGKFAILAHLKWQHSTQSVMFKWQIRDLKNKFTKMTVWCLILKVINENLSSKNFIYLYCNGSISEGL